MKDKKTTIPYIKPYYVLLISILLAPFLIKISSIQVEKRKQEKVHSKIVEVNNSEKTFLRNLRNLDFYSDSIKVCERSSEELIKYFETGDTQYVKLYELKEEEKPKDYILAFIDYLSNEGDSKENLNKYIKHQLLSILFFAVAVAAFPGWITCCACSCCNCCCCCCIKRPCCRLPIFIIISLMNALIIASCILGIINTDKIFIGLTNTECSLLRFINEMLEGESKTIYPRWGGVATVIERLNRTVVTIQEMSKDSTIDDTNAKKNAYKSEMQTFTNAVKSACNDINADSNYIYNSYILDIAKKFGKYENNEFTEGSYADKWIKEANFSDNVEKSYTVLGEIIVSNIDKGMEKAKSMIYDMQDGIEGIKDMIGESVLDFSENLDHIGRIIFMIIFSVLLAFTVLIEALLIFLYIFSVKKCIGNCCCMICCTKFLIHVFWNIFALIMIVIFLFGTALTLVGSIGSDIFQIFAFLISEQNLQSDSPKILEDGAPILDVCMNGDGVILEQLGIKKDFLNIDSLKTYINLTDSLIESIIIKEQDTDKDIVYDELINEFNIKKSEHNFEFISSTSEQKLNLKESVSNLNNELEACEKKERWSFSCNSEFSDLETETCTSTESETEKCINPDTCLHNELNNRYPSCPLTNTQIETIKKIFSSINYIDDTNNANSIVKKGQVIKGCYRQFLTNAKNILENYTTRFTPITTIFDNFVGEGTILDFINCAFLGKNLKVLLSYLDDSVGTEFKNLGIIIFATGFEISISISLTILLIIIFSITDKISEILPEKNNINYI